MSFVVDGAEWCFDGWSAGEITEAIDELLERVLTARERNEIVWIGEDFQIRSVLDALDLWGLFSPAGPLHLKMELQQELTAWLDRACCYLDEKEWPHGILEAGIQIASDAPKENPDVAWAHYNVMAGSAVACLGLKRSGPHTTISSQGTATVHWVQNEDTHRAFWRAAINVEGDNEATLERLAPHAFPDLHFYDGVWRGLNRFTGGYAAVRSQIQLYLSVLDEHGSWAFTFPPPALRPGEAAGSKSKCRPPNKIVETRFLGLKLDMAPEKPNVYDDSKCRLAREITIGKRTLYCEWHGKLEPHQNRLHIHPPVSESNDKIIIAIFHTHLPLPGD